MKFRALRADEIECRVAQVGSSAKGAWCSLLLYKDARCDMNILDEIVGAEYWQRDHKEIKGNVYGGIGIFCGNGWIWKYDCGAESNTEAEKGEASDSFKRAGFNWGIGRELYTAPKIFVSLGEKEVEINEKSGKPQLARGTYFRVAYISYTEENEKRVIEGLVIKDKNGKDRFSQMPGIDGTQKDFNDKFSSADMRIKNLCADTGYDLNAILEHYKVKTINEMTDVQKKETVRALEAKK